MSASFLIRHACPAGLPWPVVVAWIVALGWLGRVVPAAFGLRRVPNLLLPEYDQVPAGEPTLTVVVPARNEQPNVAACLGSLLAQDYPHCRILAVDDRSTDATGSIMDALAAEHPDRLRVLHITELRPGWLGKTNALALAAAAAETDYLLFTDADVLFRADSVRRSLAYAVATGADHLVTLPTTILRRWDEGMVLGLFQTFSLWGARPWKIADPRARMDSIGIGSFNLLRRAAYLQIGGLEPQRLDVLEDITLGRRVKRAGLRQRIAFGRGLANVHWASGAFGLVEVMTKNIFSAFRFHISLALGACIWLLLFFVAPLPALCFAAVRVPAGIAVACTVWGYMLLRPTSGIPARNGLLAPVAGLLFTYTLLRSMVTTLRQGGVVWRGTFYPLAELRKHSTPLL
ncbi:MAG: glycosyltransferase [Acidobacteriota bacterium]|nr:glycosyltransferase [Acidobacteriota bacterium]